MVFHGVAVFIHYKNDQSWWYYKQKNRENNKKWPHIPDHPYIILIIDGSGSGKTNVFLNLINKENDIDKIYLHARDLS